MVLYFTLRAVGGGGEGEALWRLEQEVTRSEVVGQPGMSCEMPARMFLCFLGLL